MTREEHQKIVDAVIDAYKDNEMGGKYSKAFNHGVQSAFNRVCKALEDIKNQQQPSEDTDVIKVSKGAVKARQGRFVIYDVDWLKENFYTTEEKIYGQPQQPCEDCISRQALRRKLQEHHDFFINAYGGFSNISLNDKSRVDEIDNCIAMVVNEPPVTPKYTDEEIDKIQAVEQAYVDKMVELAVEESRREWLNKALEAQPCEDCISRQAVLDVINFEDKWLFDAKSHNADTHIAFSGLESRVKALPSVTPQRPKGKWIEYCGGLQCSECGWEVDDEYYLGQRVACPNCGAEMEEGE